MDADIVEMAKSCSVCQVHQHSPASAPLHPWEWPDTPWSRLHLDFAGPFLGHMYLITVDAHSKWLDVQVMSSITTANTIEKLRTLFANNSQNRKKAMTTKRCQDLSLLETLCMWRTSPHQSISGYQIP